MKNRSKLFLAIISLCLLYGSYVFYSKYMCIHTSSDSVNEGFVVQANRNENNLYQRRQQKDPNFWKNAIIPTDTTPIDVVIPVIEKDLETVGYTLDSVKKLVNHKIGTIYLVAPESDAIKQFSDANGCTYVNESELMPSPEFQKMGGWILQQFIKLCADKIVQNEHFLVVDADTLYLRPVIYRYFGQYLVNVHWDCSAIRKTTTAKILGNPKTYIYDFVGHNMLFSKKILQEMKDHITKTHGEEWHTYLLKFINADKDNKAGFSEYELYVTYLTEFSNVAYKFVSNANITVHRNLLPHLDKIIPAYAGEYKTISMHSFIKF